MNIAEMRKHKQNKERVKELTEYLDELTKMSNFLFDSLHFRLSFAIIEVVEDARIQYQMEIYELNKIINSFKLKTKKKEGQ